MAARLPTSDEINVFDSLDERSAAEHFLGKDLEQAQCLFAENFLRYQEDLMWMGPKAFAFYVHAAIAYFLSGEADNDIVAFSSFLALIEFRREYEPAEMARVAPLLRESIPRMLETLGRSGLDDEVYRVSFDDLAGQYRIFLAELGG